MNNDPILQLLQSGKTEKAFRALYSVYPKVRSMVRKSGGDAADAADIFQEALIIVHRKFTSGDSGIRVSVASYLYGVCRYLWYKHHRSRPHTIAGDDPAVEEAEVETWIEHDQKVKLAEKVLLLIGEKCRELLTGFYIRRMSMADIARSYGYASENAAKTRKYKCLEFARNKFDEMYRKP